MPYAVLHILVPMILVDLVRDHLLKQKKKLLPNKFVLLAGLAGLLPDIDVPISLILFGNLDFHRTITHTIWIPISLFILFLYFFLVNKKPFYYKFFLMFFIGFSIHIILDYAIFGTVSLFFPLNEEVFGLNILPITEMYIFYSSVDAIILFIWLIHEELEHKISDFF